MKTVRKLPLVFSILLVFVVACVGSSIPSTPTSVPTPASTAVKISPFVVPVIVIDASGKEIGLASAFLVDEKEGLFVTNAHVVAAGEKLKVRLGDKWYPVETKEEWIHWEADLAVMKLDSKGVVLPEAAILEVSPVVMGSMVRIEGYIVEKVDEKSEYIDSYFVNGLIEKINADWSLTLESKLDRIELIFSLLKDGTIKELPLKDFGAIPNKYKKWFYQNYIVVEVKDYPAKKFRDGLSGSPVIAEDGKVIGVFSTSTPLLGLVVPSVEIKFLIEIVKHDLAVR